MLTWVCVLPPNTQHVLQRICGHIGDDHLVASESAETDQEREAALLGPSGTLVVWRSDGQDDFLLKQPLRRALEWRLLQQRRSLQCPASLGRARRQGRCWCSGSRACSFSVTWSRRDCLRSGRHAAD